MSLWPMCLCGRPITGTGVNLCPPCTRRTNRLQREHTLSYLLLPVVQFKDHIIPEDWEDPC